MPLSIEIAANAGACYGVKRALEMAHKAIAEPGPVHTLGPLIHNPRVVDDLANSGISVANTLEEAKSGTLVLRSHGTDPKVIKAACDRGFNVIDATCPYVSKVQREARQLADDGYAVVIIGEPGHAEVEGIRAWAGEAVVAVADTPDLLPATLPAKVGVVIQTTQSQNRVDLIIAVLKDRVEELRVEETVCFATQERQTAANDVSSRSDVMIVIGGRNSGNTRRLYEICKAQCDSTYHIECSDELQAVWFIDANRVGITAGASTPQEHIDDVVSWLKSYDNPRSCL